MRAKYTYLIVIAILYSFLISAQGYEEQYEKCSEPLRSLGTKIDSLYLVRAIERDSCLIGSIAPNFKAISISGEKIELSKLKGQVIVLNFWFTTCQPCIEEMPALNKLVEHYWGNKVVFFSFAYEDKSTLLRFFKEHPFKFTTFANAENIRKDKFKLLPIWPYTIIIDKEGKISKMSLGGSGENTFDLYKKTIDELLKK
jgi:thiol-disulfide isomerase/thioredoxin